MRPPIFVRALTDAERQTLEDGLRSQDVFVLRRCQILLASARGERAPAIARQVGVSDEAVRKVIRTFNEKGVRALQRKSRRPKTIHAAFDAQGLEQLKSLLHQSPRTWGKPTSVWTLELAAQVSCEQGLTKERVSGETIRASLQRLGLRWQRAKRWISSPDPAYARKKTGGTA